MGQDGGGQGDGLPQADQVPLLQRKGGGEGAHPEFRALHVDEELRRDAALPGGGPEVLDLPRGGGEARVGEVQPHARHARPEEPDQGLPIGTGGAQGSVNLKHRGLLSGTGPPGSRCRAGGRRPFP